MTVHELAEALHLETIVEADGKRKIDGCYIGDLLSWVMGRAQSGNAWITIMSNINIVAVASLADVSCIILAEGVTVEENVRAVAEAKGVNLLASERTAYELAASLKDLIE